MFPLMFLKKYNILYIWEFNLWLKLEDEKNGLQEKMFFLESDIALLATTTTVDHLIVLQL